VEFIEYPDRDFLAMSLANNLVGDLRNALSNQERASFVVPGGTTPGRVFDTLCATDIDWDRVDLMLSDERWVPNTNDRSNTRLLEQRMLVDHAAKARLVPLYLPYETPEEAMETLTQECSCVFPISVLLLGMGSDMHTASLFPGADQLELALSNEAPVLVPMRAPGASESRITLSAPFLNGAMRKHLIIFGEEKKAAFEKAQFLSPKAAPVAAILDALNVHWAA
jgi:6-phosphogluconolactonase